MVKDNNFSLENCTGHPASFGENDVNFTERLISDIENNKRIIVRKCQAETSASDHFKYFSKTKYNSHNDDNAKHRL